MYLPGDQVVITCPSGYRVSGSINRICRSDLTWTGEATACTTEGIALKRKDFPLGLALGGGVGLFLVILIVIVAVIICVSRLRGSNSTNNPVDSGVYFYPLELDEQQADPIYESTIEEAYQPTARISMTYTTVVGDADVQPVGQLCT